MATNGVVDASGTIPSGRDAVVDQSLKLNAYKLDLSKAHVYKYELEFHTAGFLTQPEKKRIFHKLLRQSQLYDVEHYAVADKSFALFLPQRNHTLDHKVFHVWSRATRDWSPGSIRGSRLIGEDIFERVHSWILSTDFIEEGVDGRLEGSAYPPREVELCKVTAKCTQLNFTTLQTEDGDNRTSMLEALDAIFQQGANCSERYWYGSAKEWAPKTVLAHGNKTYDLRSVPRSTGAATTLCFGIQATSAIVGKDVFRITKPCHAFFLKDNNLAQLLFALFGERLANFSSTELEELLRGVAVQRIGFDVEEIVGLQPFTDSGRSAIQKCRFNFPIFREKLPKVKVGYKGNSYCLPATDFRVLSGQKVNRGLLQQSKEIFDWNLIDKFIQRTKTELASETSTDRAAFLWAGINFTMLKAFDILLADPSGSSNTFPFADMNVTKHASVSGKLTKQIHAGQQSQAISVFHGTPIFVVVFAHNKNLEAKALQGVKDLFQKYTAQGMLTVECASSASLQVVKYDLDMPSPGKSATVPRVIFGLWSKAHGSSTEIDDLYSQQKHLCNSSGEIKSLLTSIAVDNVEDLLTGGSEAAAAKSASKKIASAFSKLLVMQQSLEYSSAVGESGQAANASEGVADTPAVATGSAEVVFIAAHVVPILPLKSKKVLKAESEAKNPVKGPYAGNKFLVTLAASVGGAPPFKTLSYLQTEASLASSEAKLKKSSEKSMTRSTPSAKTCTEKLNKLLGPERVRGCEFVIVRSGAHPSKDEKTESTSAEELELTYEERLALLRAAELELFQSYAETSGATLASFLVSTNTGIRLLVEPAKPPALPAKSAADAPVEAPGTMTTMSLQPDSASQLLQKSAAGTSPSWATSLIAPQSRGCTSASHNVCRHESQMPWSSKYLAPVAVARKASRYVLRRGLDRETGSVNISDGLSGAVHVL